MDEKTLREIKERVKESDKIRYELKIKVKRQEVVDIELLIAEVKRLQGEVEHYKNSMLDKAEENGKVMFQNATLRGEVKHLKAELAELRRQIADGELVKVVRCGECIKRYTSICSARHERADMDYCNSGERREKE
jgi:predicted nuclease with TOPRIM domain